MENLEKRIDECIKKMRVDISNIENGDTGRTKRICHGRRHRRHTKKTNGKVAKGTGNGTKVPGTIWLYEYY